MTRRRRPNWRAAVLVLQIRWQKVRTKRQKAGLGVADGVALPPEYYSHASRDPKSVRNTVARRMTFVTDIWSRLRRAALGGVIVVRIFLIFEKGSDRTGRRILFLAAYAHSGGAWVRVRCEKCVGLTLVRQFSQRTRISDARTLRETCAASFSQRTRMSASLTCAYAAKQV